jgi:hypothetical protein
MGMALKRIFLFPKEAMEFSTQLIWLLFGRMFATKRTVGEWTWTEPEAQPNIFPRPEIGRDPKACGNSRYVLPLGCVGRQPTPTGSLRRRKI